MAGVSPQILTFLVREGFANQLHWETHGKKSSIKSFLVLFDFQLKFALDIKVMV